MFRLNVKCIHIIVCFDKTGHFLCLWLVNPEILLVVYLLTLNEIHHIYDYNFDYYDEERRRRRGSSNGWL